MRKYPVPAATKEYDCMADRENNPMTAATTMPGTNIFFWKNSIALSLCTVCDIICAQYSANPAKIKG